MHDNDTNDTDSTDEHPTTTSRPIKETVYDFGSVVVRVEREFGYDEYQFHVVRPRSGDAYPGYTDDPLGEHDHVRGDEEFKNPVVPCDSNRYYLSEADVEEIPAKVVRKVEELGFTVVTGVDAGWESWAGRPEFDGSKTYIDLRESEEYTAHRN